VIEIAAMTLLAALLVDERGFRRVTLRKGLRVYHGTSVDPGGEWWKHDQPMPPFWVSEDEGVADWFQTWQESEEGEGLRRILIYELTRDIGDIVLISGPEEMDRWMRALGLDPEGWGAQEAAEATCGRAGGWVIEGNYPSGHDIMLCDTSGLKLVDVIGAPEKPPNRGYKVVAEKAGRYYSIFDGSPIPTDGIHRSPGGLFLGTNIQFVTDYYTGMVDEDEYDGEAILIYAYTDSDLLHGNPAEDGEVVVSQATVIAVHEPPESNDGTVRFDIDGREVRSWRGRRVVVWIDPVKMDPDWATEPSFYVGPGGTGAAIGTRYADFGKWLEKGFPVDPSRVTLREDGQIVFGDGRHRFAYLRDQGLRRFPVLVPTNQANEFERRYGAEP
jgi:hypothetical protein